jgi:hypothetical protein
MCGKMRRIVLTENGIQLYAFVIVLNIAAYEKCIHILVSKPKGQIYDKI